MNKKQRQLDGWLYEEPRMKFHFIAPATRMMVNTSVAGNSISPMQEEDEIEW